MNKSNKNPSPITGYQLIDLQFTQVLLKGNSLQDQKKIKVINSIDIPHS